MTAVRDTRQIISNIFALKTGRRLYEIPADNFKFVRVDRPKVWLHGRSSINIRKSSPPNFFCILYKSIGRVLTHAALVSAVYKTLLRVEKWKVFILS